MLTTEKQLAKRAARRDRQTFAELYNLYLDKIYRYVYFRINRTDEAEDLTAQVFLKAWEAIGSYRWEDYPFSAWVYRIAYNQIIDHYRTQGETWLLDTVRTEESGPNLPEGAERAFTINQIRFALSYLPESQQEVIILRFFGGYSTSEVAVIMDKRPEVIRELQYRALCALPPHIVESSPELAYQPQSLESV